MKKLIILLIFASFESFGQSITITPNSLENSELIHLKKQGIGLDHRSTDNVSGVGTYTGTSSTFIQTHTDHPLKFATNNGVARMTLQTDGNLGVGTENPTQKLHVVGGGYFTGDINVNGSTTTSNVNVNNGSNILKFSEWILTGFQIPSIAGKSCGTQTYSTTGVTISDIIILNLESVASVISVGNVRASATDQIEVKFCNIGPTASAVQNSIQMRVTVIR
jgi:hypothetical protein